MFCTPSAKVFSDPLV